jgi:hypothetical protein
MAYNSGSERLQRKSRKTQGRTVYANMRIMPINTEKNTQPVQNFVHSPLNRFAAIAAEMTIVVENS